MPDFAQGQSNSAPPTPPPTSTDSVPAPEPSPRARLIQLVRWWADPSHWQFVIGRILRRDELTATANELAKQQEVNRLLPVLDAYNCARDELRRVDNEREDITRRITEWHGQWGEMRQLTETHYPEFLGDFTPWGIPIGPLTADEIAQRCQSMNRLVGRISMASNVPQLSGSAGTGPGATTGIDLPRARHSPDFASVHWYGTNYIFTPTQRACVKLLWAAWENDTPDVGQEILEKAGSEGSQLKDLFKNHPAWGKMILPTPGLRATFRLIEPTS